MLIIIYIQKQEFAIKFSLKPILNNIYLLLYNLQIFP